MYDVDNPVNIQGVKRPTRVTLNSLSALKPVSATAPGRQIPNIRPAVIATGHQSLADRGQKLINVNYMDDLSNFYSFLTTM